MPPERKRWKGKFVSQKKHASLTKSSEIGRANKNSFVVEKQCNQVRTQVDESNARGPIVPVEGNRIVNIAHLAENMFCASCKKELLLQDITSETTKGLASIFYIKCRSCLLINAVKSSESKKNSVTNYTYSCINAKTVLGVMHAGFGHSHLNKFLSTIDVPCLQEKVFKNHERLVGPIVEFVAKESCIEAANLEKMLTLANVEKLKKLLPTELQEGFLVVQAEPIDENENNTARIFASYDMGWSQRSNGYSYDSLNGYCALIGMQTGKILDYCTKNRKCRACDVGKAGGKVKPHDCRKNFYGSSKSMESAGAVELVTKSEILKMANIEVGVFIGDNDSSSMSALKNAGMQHIIKQADMNHTIKGVGNLLHEIKNKSDPDRELTSDMIKHIQRCFTYAVKQNKGDENKMKEAIENIPYHLFGFHDNCGDWCAQRLEKENLSMTRLKSNDLFESLKRIFLKLSENAIKFVSAASSQANESLNNTMCSKASKRVSYSTSESADYRFACAVAQKNYGFTYVQKTLDSLSVNNSSILNKYVNKETNNFIKKKENASKPQFKKQRLQLKAQRAQLRNRKENSEGDTYKSNMVLLDETGSNQSQTINSAATNIASIPYTSLDFSFIFFDIETGGFNLSKDILQISMKSENKIFNCFISPTNPIDASATLVNGFSIVQKQLFQRGNKVDTLSRRLAFQELLQYLKSFKKKCILIAHNCIFDSTRVILAIKDLGVLDEFKNVIHGFTDTLSLFKKKFPKREGGYKLTTLATDLLSLPCEGAHDALFDVILLEKLTTSQIPLADIISNSKSLDNISHNLDNEARAKKLTSSFEPMKDIISSSMIKRLCFSGISYNILIDKYKTDGKEGTLMFLRGDIDGKPQIIKTKKVLNLILNHFER